MSRTTNLLALLLIPFISVSAQESENKLDDLLPIRGFCIAAPRPGEVDTFVNFIEKELAPRYVNTLILRVDYNYQYTSHPELRDSITMSVREVKKLVDACRRHGIRIIPQINMLGHQSWAGDLGMLLKRYPQFDETPHVQMPVEYKWPNPDGLYCKSYCPLHPEVHDVVFDLIDEICDVYEADAFHAGMDEVFYIGDDKCPRCKGRDKAELFAGEVTRLRNHLALKGRRLWIWGDRLLDGRATGLGMWEASMNNTHRAIDMIPKDVMICDWHYERPDKTAVIFALKGFQVVTCPWRNGGVATQQLDDMLSFRASATAATKENFQGMVQTVWSGANQFLEEFYGENEGETLSAAECFRTLYDKVGQLE